MKKLTARKYISNRLREQRCPHGKLRPTPEQVQRIHELEATHRKWTWEEKREWARLLKVNCYGCRTEP